MRRTTDTFTRRATGALAALGIAAATIAIGSSSTASAGVEPGSSTCFPSGVPLGAGMVVNGTAARAVDRGFLNFYAPIDGVDPTANSSVNYEVGPAVANSVVVPVFAPDGQVCAYSSAGVDVIADVAGYIDPEVLLTFDDGAAFRVLDSRDVRKFDAGETFCFAPASNSEVGQPIIANLTIAAPEASGFANLYPKGAVPDATSAINFVANRNIANGLTVTAGLDGEICAFTSVRAHVIVDVVGGVMSDRYRPAQPDNSPVRAVDTRNFSPFVAGETRCFRLDSNPGEAVVLNVTSVRSAGPGFLNVFSPDATDPDGNSSVNFQAGANFANGLIVPGGFEGDTCVFASESTDVIIDVSGFFTPGTFFPVSDDGSADRVLDTR
ncbi:MAG: hypothetical protein AAF945_04050 [Actinomycetota bacterium]